MFEQYIEPTNSERNVTIAAVLALAMIVRVTAENVVLKQLMEGMLIRISWQMKHSNTEANFEALCLPYYGSFHFLLDMKDQFCQGVFEKLEAVPCYPWYGILWSARNFKTRGTISYVYNMSHVMRLPLELRDGQMHGLLFCFMQELKS